MEYSFKKSTQNIPHKRAPFVVIQKERIKMDEDSNAMCVDIKTTEIGTQA